MSNSEIESCLIEGSKKCNEGISTAFVAYEICTKVIDTTYSRQKIPVVMGQKKSELSEDTASSFG